MALWLMLIAPITLIPRKKENNFKGSAYATRTAALNSGPCVY